MKQKVGFTFSFSYLVIIQYWKLSRPARSYFRKKIKC